ncbi:MAG TPA: RidA family protein [Spirochaetia bacterium]|nr:RidA family protein [Spirochaetia bacterium]
MFSLIANSEAVRSGQLLFFGGMVARGESGALVAPGDVEAQTRVIIQKIGAYLSEAGLGLRNLVYVTVYLPDVELFDRMNSAYVQAMPAPLPPRKLIITPIVVAGAMVEMTAIAGISPREVLPPPNRWTTDGK